MLGNASTENMSKCREIRWNRIKGKIEDKKIKELVRQGDKEVLYAGARQEKKNIQPTYSIH